MPSADEARKAQVASARAASALISVRTSRSGTLVGTLSFVSAACRVSACGVRIRSFWLSRRAGATAALGLRLRRRHNGVAELTVCSRLRISSARICRSNFARFRERRSLRRKISARAARINATGISADSAPIMACELAMAPAAAVGEDGGIGESNRVRGGGRE